MSAANKARNKAEEWAGKVMQKFGGATKNRKMQAKGVAAQADAKTRQTGERVKDAGKNAAKDARKSARRR